MTEENKNNIVKSYVEYTIDGELTQRYCILNFQGQEAVFNFWIPKGATDIIWKFYTDFKINVVSAKVSFRGKSHSCKVLISEDGVLTYCHLPHDSTEQIQMICTLYVLSLQEGYAKLRTEYSNKLAHIQLLQKSTQEYEKKLEQLERKEREFIKEIEQLKRNEQKHLGKIAQIEEKEQELYDIYHSNSWKIAVKLREIINGILPMNSRRRLVAKITFCIICNPIKSLKRVSLKRIKKLLVGVTQNDHENTMNKLNNCVHGQDLDFKLSKLYSVREDTSFENYAAISFPYYATPKVSIIIPVYNQFHYTYNCLQSIRENTVDVPYEIILADDCSTDFTTRIQEIVQGIKIVVHQDNLRFLRNCNAAAKHAKGEYILFLNNDTQVQQNWLTSLVELLERDPMVGMVGSKLVYPNGTLQEAGGILWKDGSAWNYGNKKNPAFPEYNYVKEVDYISGASIMIRAKLWNQLGGFDEIFAPAYCEDSDLAFSVRKAGYKVLYQPQSVVVHFEGISNGTDTSQGQKSYQIANQKKFYEKWGAELREIHNPNGEGVFLARDRSLRRKTILMVDHYVPTFDKDAGSRTVYQYLQLFVKQGYNVKFIGDNFAVMEPYITLLQQMGIEVLYGVYYANNWKDWIKENGQYIDYIWLNRPHISIKYIDWIKENTNAKVIYYGHDLHYLRVKREYEIKKDKHLLEEMKQWREKEQYLISHADISYYPSQIEVEEVRKELPEVAVKAVPAYIYDTVTDETYCMNNREGLLFVGGYVHTPNVDAAIWMAKNIMPEIIKAFPDMTLHLVGSNAPVEIKKLANKNVIYEGTVDDDQLSMLYRSCRLVVVPLRYGAGIKGKVIEAMAKGCPVVTTSMGVEGISGAESILSIGDTTKEFANRIIEMYQNEEALVNCSRASREYICQHFSPNNAIMEIMADFDFSKQEE